MHDALAALGFAPRPEPRAPRGLRYMLDNCPYREAVRENQPAVCTPAPGDHARACSTASIPARGSRASSPKDPYAAGCLIELEGVASAG